MKEVFRSPEEHRIAVAACDALLPKRRKPSKNPFHRDLAALQKPLRTWISLLRLALRREHAGYYDAALEYEFDDDAEAATPTLTSVESDNSGILPSDTRLEEIVRDILATVPMVERKTGPSSVGRFPIPDNDNANVAYDSGGRLVRLGGFKFAAELGVYETKGGNERAPKSPRGAVTEYATEKGRWAAITETIGGPVKQSEQTKRSRPWLRRALSVKGEWPDGFHDKQYPPHGRYVSDPPTARSIESRAELSAWGVDGSVPLHQACHRHQLSPRIANDNRPALPSLVKKKKPCDPWDSFLGMSFGGGITGAPPAMIEPAACAYEMRGEFAAIKADLGQEHVTILNLVTEGLAEGETTTFTKIGKQLGFRDDDTAAKRGKAALEAACARLMEILANRENISAMAAQPPGLRGFRPTYE